MKRIVSFSLWGETPRYLVGARRNVDLVARWYPGWTCRFYVGRSVPRALVGELASHPHVEVVQRDEPGDWTGLFWRFLAAAEPDVDAVVFRDTDSRVGARERSAVDAWLASGRPAHVMRDHPEHWAPVLGGLWGVRGGVLPDMESLTQGWARADRWQTDQEFLAAVVAPRLRGGWLEHDEYFGGRRFPTAWEGSGYVGQPFDERERPLAGGPGPLERRALQLGGWLRRLLGRQPKLLGGAP